MRLDRWMREVRPELSWTRIRELIARGHVTVDGEIVRDEGAEVRASATVSIDEARPAMRHARLALPRLYEDSQILVVDKPAGLLTIATDPALREIEDSVLGRAREYARHLHGRRGYAGVLHRLDRDTSGALAIALTREAHAAGRELFAEHRFERRYLAIVSGVPVPEHGTVDAAIAREYADGRRRLAGPRDEARQAVTHYQVLEAFATASLVELRLETGRQHQIRLHLEWLGHPLLGEKVYTGSGGSSGSGRSGKGITPKRQMLHAWRLAFPHPVRNNAIAVEAPVPADFERLLRHLAVERKR